MSECFETFNPSTCPGAAPGPTQQGGMHNSTRLAAVGREALHSVLCCVVRVSGWVVWLRFGLLLPAVWWKATGCMLRRYTNRH